MDLREAWAAQAALEIPEGTPTATAMNTLVQEIAQENVPVPLDETPQQPQEQDVPSLVDPDEQDSNADEGEIVAQDTTKEDHDDEANLPPARIRNKYKRELEKEREERQRREIELAELRARLEERERNNAAVQTPPEPIPDPNYDKEAYLEYQLKQQEKQINALVEKQKTIEQRTLYNDALKGLETYEQRFAQDTEDYSGAKSHLITSLAREMKLQNPLLTEDEIQNNITTYQLRLGAEYAQRTKRNPAELFYDMAKLRGYAPQEKTRSDNTASKQPTVDPQKVKSNASRSLSFVGQPAAAPLTSTPLSGGRTPEEWRNMSISELRELDRQQKEAARRAGQ